MTQEYSTRLKDTQENSIYSTKLGTPNSTKDTQLKMMATIKDVIYMKLLDQQIINQMYIKINNNLLHLFGSFL